MQVGMQVDVQVDVQVERWPWFCGWNRRRKKIQKSHSFRDGFPLTLLETRTDTNTNQLEP